MKIAQFIDTYDVGGAETMTINLSLALKEKGHDVVVLHAGSEYLRSVCEEKGLSSRVIPDLKLYKSILTAPLFSLKFAHFLREQKFDVLHTHLYGPITGTFLGAGIKGIKHIGTLHDVYSVKERIGRGVILRLAQFFGTKLVAVSKDMEAFYQNYLPIAKPIKTIHNGIPVYSRNEEKHDPLESFGAHNAIRIVTVGRLVSLKRQAQQLKAMHPLLKTLNINMFFVGDGPERQNIEKAITDLGVEDCVFLLGSRNDVENILQHSDVFVLASESEGLSCSIVEAMAAGLPCVVSDVGGNKELITSEENGFVLKKKILKRLPNN